jgi:hypothetical protein
MFPSEFPEALQAEASARKKEEKITENDFLALLTDLDSEFVQKESVVVEKNLPEPSKKKKWIEETEEPPAITKKKLRHDHSLMIKNFKPTAAAPTKEETTKSTPPTISPKTKEVTPEPAKKATQTEKEEGGVINMSVYFSQQVKQGSSAHKALMEMLQ